MLAEKRKHKGVTVDKARELLEDPNTFGCLMAAAGDADGMVSGSTTSTANTIRPALQVSLAPLQAEGAVTAPSNGGLWRSAGTRTVHCSSASLLSHLACDAF